MMVKYFPSSGFYSPSYIGSSASHTSKIILFPVFNKPKQDLSNPKIMNRKQIKHFSRIFYFLVQIQGSMKLYIHSLHQQLQSLWGKISLSQYSFSALEGSKRSVDWSSSSRYFIMCFYILLHVTYLFIILFYVVEKRITKISCLKPEQLFATYTRMKRLKLELHSLSFLANLCYLKLHFLPQ